jgi:hypothetical protein
LSSLPEEFSATRPLPRKSRRETAEERVERYRRKRRAQFIGVVVFSVLMLVAVITAVVLNQFGPAKSASTQNPNACSAPLTPADPKGVTVNVFNMTTKPGMATGIADQFKKRNFTVGSVGNYSGPLTRPGRTSVLAVIKARPDMEAEALAVQRQLPDSVYQADSARKSRTVDVFLLDQVPQLNTTVDTAEGPLICR